MTTGVSAEIDGDPSLSKVIQAMFPCGSITGAPKLSAMEIIHEVEHWTRGPYCGSIGEFAKTGAGHEDGGRGGWRSRFNVAIRTLRLTPETRSEGHTSELQSLMRISYAVFCLKKKRTHPIQITQHNNQTQQHAIRHDYKHYIHHLQSTHVLYTHTTTTQSI